jgi:hypothetical protein
LRHQFGWLNTQRHGEPLHGLYSDGPLPAFDQENVGSVKPDGVGQTQYGPLIAITGTLL